MGQICENYPVTFINRPSSLATDEATANEVIEHFITTLPSQYNNKTTVIFYLQPTSPLRTEKHIEKAIKILTSRQSRSVISLTEIKEMIFKCFSLDKSGLVCPSLMKS